jgi:hypothetical protein
MLGFSMRYGLVFHQGTAEIALRHAPRLAEVNHAVMDIDFWFCQFGQSALESQHRRGLGPDLHHADLADAADHA